MLRALVVLLLLANLGVWVWQSGWVSPDESLSARTEMEPDRIRIMAARQVADPAPPRPVPVPAPEPEPASAPAPSPVAADVRRCLEAGPFTVAELPALKAAMVKAPANLVVLQDITIKGTWLIYMGPFGDAEALDRKRAELRRMRDLSFEDAKGPASLVPGLVLGRFNQETAARNALENMRLRGIRTARVVMLKPAQELTVARAPQASSGQAAQLQSLTLPAGRSFKACEG